MNGRSNSAYMMNNNGNKLSVNDRLYKDATDRLERNFFAQGDDTQFGKHKPNISQTSKSIINKNEMFQGNLKNFHDRQNEFLKK